MRLAVLRRRQAAAPDGPPAAFLFLGAWMCCFHFMYYDALLGALVPVPAVHRAAPLPVAALGRAGPGAREPPRGRTVVAYHRPTLPAGLPPPVTMDIATARGLDAQPHGSQRCLMLLVIHYVFPMLGWGDHWVSPGTRFSCGCVGCGAVGNGCGTARRWRRAGTTASRRSPPSMLIGGRRGERNGEAAPPDKDSIRPALPADDAS